MAKYAEYYDYVTGMGVIVPDTSKIKENVETEWKDVFGNNLNTDPETPQGRIIEMETRTRKFALEVAAIVSNMLNIDKDYGFVLDDIGALFQISRKSATYTQVSITMSGVVDTVIPIGTRLRSDDGDIFINDYEYVIGSTGYVTGTFHAEEAGEIPAEAETITTILDSVQGLESVINNASGNMGALQESDNSFRNRIKASLNINATSVLDAVKSAVADIPEVIQVNAYENITETGFVLNTYFNIPAHGIGVVIDYLETDPVSQPIAYKIAEAIYKKKTLGAGYVGAESGQESIANQYLKTVAYSDPNDGQEHTVTFVKAIDLSVNVVITVQRRNYSGDDLTGDIKTAIANFVNGDNPEVDRVGIGGTLSPFEIAAAVSSDIPDIFIQDVKIKKSSAGGVPSTNPIVLSEAEKLVINPENITVNIQ